MLDQKTLDNLWDFDNPELSEQRFREAMADEKYDADERAELATQLGRAIGLQARFEEADALLDAIDSEDEPTIGIRIILERLQEWWAVPAGTPKSPNGGQPPVIFIVVKFKVKPDWSDKWLGLVADFTEATRQEPGNLWFDWSRSVDDPNEFVLVEAFKDDAAGDHVNSEHFKKAMADMPQALAETPRIISRQLDGDGWDRMGELTI